MISVNCDGLRQLAKDLEKLPLEVRGQTLSGAVREAAEPMRIEMIQNAPHLIAYGAAPTLNERKTGKWEDIKKRNKRMGGEMQRSIKLYPMRNLEFKDLEAGYYLGPNIFYARFYELGRKGQPARPFVGPIWDRGKEGFLDRLKVALRKRIDRGLKKYGWHW